MAASTPETGSPRRRAFVGAALAVGAVVALVAVLFLRAGPPDEVTATYDGSELTLALENGPSITVPAGAAQPGSLVRIAVVDSESLPGAPGYAGEVVGAWDIDVAGGITAPVTLRFPVPVTDEPWLLIHYRDGSWGATDFELVDGQVVAVVDSLSWWETILSPFAAAARWALDRVPVVFDWLNSIEDLPLCDNPDMRIRVSNVAGDELVGGCVERVDATRTDLIVKNRRAFFLDVYSPSPSMTGAARATLLPLPSCCPGGVNLAGGQESAWDAQFLGTSIDIRGRLSFHSSGATVAFLALSLVPGIGELIDPRLLDVAYHVLVEAPSMQDAGTLFSRGEYAEGLNTIASALTPAFLFEIAVQILEQSVEKYGDIIARKIGECQCGLP